MQADITAARPYAQAVFELARDAGSYTQWTAMLELLELVVADPQIQALLGNPTVKKEVLAQLVLDVCGSRLTDHGRNFVSTLAAVGRLGLVPQIAVLFEQRRIEAEGVANVEILSAYPLEEKDKQQIAAAMARRLGRKVTTTTHIDKRLIGGVVIRCGDAVIDASVLGRLQQLSNVLAE